MMKPPQDVRIIDWPTSVMWFGDDGILYAISKKAQPASMEETRESIKKFRELIGDKKICLLIDVTHSSESSKEVRNYVAEEFPKFITAIAMVSDSALGKMLANLFFTLKTQPYPTKMFNDEKEAHNWLKAYL